MEYIGMAWAALMFTFTLWTLVRWREDEQL